MLADARGRIWVGTFGGGVGVVGSWPPPPGEAPRFRTLTTRQGLSDNSVAALLPDAKGRIWASTARGLTMIPADGGPARVLTMRDGVRVRTYLPRSAARAPGASCCSAGWAAFPSCCPGGPSSPARRRASASPAWRWMATRCRRASPPPPARGSTCPQACGGCGWTSPCSTSTPPPARATPTASLTSTRNGPRPTRRTPPPISSVCLPACTACRCAPGPDPWAPAPRPRPRWSWLCRRAGLRAPGSACWR
ncbi:two-component regulator propeller domain-containing protein [Teichococcus aestuarii]|uniref:two-component regulator propeller domain-containing protein n=1 Tax=Teichococcus aestuarii TaxID=568898 RepID=UPI003621058A